MTNKDEKKYVDPEFNHMTYMEEPTIDDKKNEDSFQSEMTAGQYWEFQKKRKEELAKLIGNSQSKVSSIHYSTNTEVEKNDYGYDPDIDPFIETEEKVLFKKAK